MYCDTEPVVVDEFLITSRGPGTAIAFALTVAEKLVGKQVMKDVADGMLIQID